MSDLKSTISNRIVTPNVNTAFNTPSTGLVKKAYEDENVCDITYFDSNGSPKNKSKVEVKVKSTRDNWFPQTGSLVSIEVYEDNVIITGEVVSDFTTQMKTQQMAKNDIYTDGGDSSVGSYIF